MKCRDHDRNRRQISRSSARNGTQRVWKTKTFNSTSFPKIVFSTPLFFYNAQAVIQTMENLEHRITQSDYAQFTNNETGDTKSLIDKPTGTKSRTLIFSFLFIFFIFSSLILFVIFIKSEKHAGMAEL